MTDRARVSSLPDETPVGDLPLRQYTTNALRAGHVLPLGELRAMGDRERGHAAFADVRALVPAPEGGRHEGR